MFFFLDRPSCCHESLGDRYQIIAFDVRTTQHLISKIPVVLGYPVVLKSLLFSKRFFVACVQKGEGGVCTQATFFCRTSAFPAPFWIIKIAIFTSYAQMAKTCITLVHKTQQGDFSMSKAGRYLSSAKEWTWDLFSERVSWQSWWFCYTYLGQYAVQIELKHRRKTQIKTR